MSNNIKNVWKEYSNATKDNSSRYISYQERLVKWEEEHSKLLEAVPETEAILSIKKKIEEVEKSKAALDDLYNKELSELNKRQRKKGEITPSMKSYSDMRIACDSLVKKYEERLLVLINQERAILLENHNKEKPRMLELHKEKEIYDRIMRAYQRCEFNEFNICEMLKEKTGKNYYVVYKAIPSNNLVGEYDVHLNLMETSMLKNVHCGYDKPKCIMSFNVEEGFTLNTSDISWAQNFLRDMYKVEDIIAENFRQLEIQCPLLFNNMLKLMEKPYYELLKEDQKIDR